jgi:hypothetical protein
VRGGWPFAATLSLGALRVEGAGATSRRLRPRRGPRGAARGPAAARTAARGVRRPGPAAARRVDFPFAADSLVAALPLERDTPPNSAEVAAERLRIGTPAGALELMRGTLALAGSSSATEGRRRSPWR